MENISELHRAEKAVFRQRFQSTAIFSRTYSAKIISLSGREVFFSARVPEFSGETASENDFFAEIASLFFGYVKKKTEKSDKKYHAVLDFSVLLREDRIILVFSVFFGEFSEKRKNTKFLSVSFAENGRMASYRKPAKKSSVDKKETR